MLVKANCKEECRFSEAPSISGVFLPLYEVLCSSFVLDHFQVIWFLPVDPAQANNCCFKQTNKTWKSSNSRASKPSQRTITSWVINHAMTKGKGGKHAKSAGVCSFQSPRSYNLHSCEKIS